LTLEGRGWGVRDECLDTRGSCHCHYCTRTSTFLDTDTDTYLCDGAGIQLSNFAHSHRTDASKPLPPESGGWCERAVSILESVHID
jgi:hypothetical protein